MATQMDVKKALEVTEKKPVKSLEVLIRESAKEIGRALPAHLNPERVTRIALTCVRLNPDLAKCTSESFLGALFMSAQLGLEPIAGRAYILPFLNNRKKPDGTWHKVMEAQFMVGYKGLAELFYRHEKAVQLDWGIVHQNDDFTYELGTNAFLKLKPAMKDRGNPIAYYVVATLQGGGKPFMVMSLEDCMEHGRKHSKTYDAKSGKFYDKSPWATSPDSMCLKTVLIQLAKLLPLSVELQRALAADETSREYRKGIDDALDLPDNTNWEKEVEATTVPSDAGDAGQANEPEAEPETVTVQIAQVTDIKGGGYEIVDMEGVIYWTASGPLALKARELAKAKTLAVLAFMEQDGKRVLGAVRAAEGK